MDQYEAQKDVAEALYKMNKPKKILYLSGKENSFVCEERLRAVEDFCKKRKLSLRVQRADFSEKKAREIVLKMGADFDAVICASDLCAIGAMMALTKMDIFRPVCGFDGISLMGYAGRQMTTVRQDFTEIAKTAVAEAERLLSGETGREVILPHEVVRIEYLDVIH